MNIFDITIVCFNNNRKYQLFTINKMETKPAIQHKIPATPSLKDIKHFTFFCPNHPDKKATYCLKDDMSQKFCTKCALTLGGALSDEIFV